MTAVFGPQEPVPGSMEIARIRVLEAAPGLVREQAQTDADSTSRGLVAAAQHSVRRMWAEMDELEAGQ